MKKLLSFCLICLVAMSAMAQNSVWVDLGLPSGTLWKSTNEKGFYYTYDEAVSQFGDNLPSREHFIELKAFCTWEWNGKGYVVTGDNGNSIILHAAGYRSCDGDVEDVGTFGAYWSSTPYKSYDLWYFYFSGEVLDMAYDKHCYGFSVRLVQ
jgi:uncharacterized protein (TIGR02145 family)